MNFKALSAAAFVSIFAFSFGAWSEPEEAPAAVLRVDSDIYHEDTDKMDAHAKSLKDDGIDINTIYKFTYDRKQNILMRALYHKPGQTFIALAKAAQKHGHVIKPFAVCAGGWTLLMYAARLPDGKYRGESIRHILRLLPTDFEKSRLLEMRNDEGKRAYDINPLPLLNPSRFERTKRGEPRAQKLTKTSRGGSAAAGGIEHAAVADPRAGGRGAPASPEGIVELLRALDASGESLPRPGDETKSADASTDLDRADHPGIVVGTVSDFVGSGSEGKTTFTQMKMKGVLATTALPRWTTVAKYPGHYITEAELKTTLVFLAAKRTRLRGDEYSLMDDTQRVAQVLMPHDRTTGELLPQFRDRAALYVNEPSRRYDDRGDLIMKKLKPNAHFVSDHDRGGVYIMTTEPTEAGDELLVCYGTGYQDVRARHGYEATCEGSFNYFIRGGKIWQGSATPNLKYPPVVVRTLASARTSEPSKASNVAGQKRPLGLGSEPPAKHHRGENDVMTGPTGSAAAAAAVRPGTQSLTPNGVRIKRSNPGLAPGGSLPKAAADNR